MGLKPIYPEGAEPPKGATSLIANGIAAGVAWAAEKAATAETSDGPVLNPTIRRAAGALAETIRNRET